jgi:hypothetical protein
MVQQFPVSSLQPLPTLLLLTARGFSEHTNRLSNDVEGGQNACVSLSKISLLCFASICLDLPRFALTSLLFESHRCIKLLNAYKYTYLCLAERSTFVQQFFERLLHAFPWKSKVRDLKGPFNGDQGNTF